MENSDQIDFIIKTAIERDPNKRRVKPVDTQDTLLNYELDESSDDSDFRIEDHEEVTDDDSSDSKSDISHDASSGEESLGDENSFVSKNICNGGINAIDPSEKLSLLKEIATSTLICSGCLGDRNDATNEIVECDNCGVTVHETCYGVTESSSTSSSNSVNPTAPWFCEACKAGVDNPICELCPNEGGIFKRTDVGKWVHLVCALYVPGIAFGEVDQLTNVTLFEMPYSKWGAKVCSLCTDLDYASTGVCIGCDAGMCKTNFHVTCAQREGLLSEAHLEEVGQADPFYAHCKQHVDKTLLQRRKRNYLCLTTRTQHRRKAIADNSASSSEEQMRIRRKLDYYKVQLYDGIPQRPIPWVPTQKMPRLLNTSTTACKLMAQKAILMDINTEVVEFQESQAVTLHEIRKKWHLVPAFSVEYITYFLDRNGRITDMRKTLEELHNKNNTLIDEQATLRLKYEQLLETSKKLTTTKIALKDTIIKMHSAILNACPRKFLPHIENIENECKIQRLTVPTAAALKIGVGFPLSSLHTANLHASRSFLTNASVAQSLAMVECTVCKKKRDQHLLVKCDTCQLYYHLYCLNPPLTRHPKKSKLYGWQCANCDKSSESEVEGVRQSGSKYRRRDSTTLNTSSDLSTTAIADGTTTTVPNTGVSDADRKLDVTVTTEGCSTTMENAPMVCPNKSAKKKKRERHKTVDDNQCLDSNQPIKVHKHKKKKKSASDEKSMPQHPRITIKIKAIPVPIGEEPPEQQPQTSYNVCNESTPRRKRRRSSVQRSSLTPKRETVDNKHVSNCGVCSIKCLDTDSVRCDVCSVPFHFSCLDPPLKKTPKRRGYSWHCEDCDDKSE